MDLSAWEWVAVSALGVFALVGVAAVVLVVIVATRYRRLLPSALTLAGALIYGASPVDLVPELLLGPLGAVDDLGLIGAALVFFLTQVRRGRRGPDAADDSVTIRQLPD